MLDSLIVTYIQFVIVLIEVEKVLSQEIECVYCKTIIVLNVLLTVHYDINFIPVTNLMHKFLPQPVYCTTTTTTRRE